MLDTETDALHIIDGNAFLIDLFRNHPNGLTTRTTLDKVRRLRHPPIFTFDGAGGNERRRALYPAYKTKRTPPGEDIFASIKVFRDGLKHVPALTLCAAGWEADDVVATLARSLAKQRPVRVCTVDRDLTQLAADPNITVTAELKDVEPRYVRLFKTLVGDPADCIAGMPRFGVKSWERINKELTLKAFEDRGTEHDPDFLGFGGGHALYWRDHFRDLLTCWDVVGLLDVPAETISANMIVGHDDPKALDAHLKRWML